MCKNKSEINEMLNSISASRWCVLKWLTVCIAISLLVIALPIAGSCLVKLISVLMLAIKPVLIGMVLAFICRPIYNKLGIYLDKIGIWLNLKLPISGGKIQLTLFGLGLFLLVMAVLFLLAKYIAPQICDLPQVFAGICDGLSKRFPDAIRTLKSCQYLKSDSELMQRISSFALQFSLSMLKSFSSLTTLALSLLFFFGFLRIGEAKGEKLTRHLDFFAVSTETKKALATAFDRLMSTLGQYFTRAIILYLGEGILYGGFFWAIRVPSGFVFGFMLGMLNLIPNLGTVLILPVILLLAFLQSYMMCIAAFVFWLFVWVLDIPAQDKMFKKCAGARLSFLELLFSYLFWAVVMDPFWGLFLAIPLTCFFKNMWVSLIPASGRFFSKVWDGLRE